MTIGILSIATNIYLDYWKTLALSIDRTTKSSEAITLHIFTDQVEKVQMFLSNLQNVEVIAHEIEPLGWPDATLRRYEIFSRFTSEITEQVLVYLDADMIVTQDISRDVYEALSVSKIALVSHPGYWRKNKFGQVSSSVRDVRGFLRTLKALVLNVNQGTWEDNQLSTAFVGKEFRKNYVCGGTWMGYRAELFELIETLKETVAVDYANGVVATWHDESHLNQWAAFNKFKLLDPSFCYVKEYRHLSSLAPKIIAVTKEVRTR